MRQLTRRSALPAVALLGLLGLNERASGQMMLPAAPRPAAVPARTPVYSAYPAYSYYQGYPTYSAYPAYRDPRAVLPSFAPRGGIGTTPYLGNTRGLGAYSVNYDRAPRSTGGVRYSYWPRRAR